jgi:hypothetical protein
MGVSTKMAAWMKKQMRDIPEGFTKADVKEEMDAIEMAKLSKAELSDISKGRSKRAMAAADELDRRQMNKDVKSGRESGPYAAKVPPITPEDHRQWKKQVSGNTPTKKQEKAAEESPKFKKGGMVTKKKAPAKAKAPATTSRSNPLNKFYGK